MIALKEKGGLNYGRRERTPQGRLLDHASDCKSILKCLATLSDATSLSSLQ